MSILCLTLISMLSFFFFHDAATTEIYTLSLHDALPIWRPEPGERPVHRNEVREKALEPRHGIADPHDRGPEAQPRSEEHTSELQSHSDLVCRLLLEKKKKDNHR